MTLVQTFRVGRLLCHALHAGKLRLDGGAMFGVVPKPLWAKRTEPDERNRIPMAMRCLLIEHDHGLVLVDTGVGNKEDSKFLDIYAVENSSPCCPTLLEDAIAETGFSPLDVKYVINTHLHFDHAGGNTVVGAAGSEDAPVSLAFPDATYVVQKGELAFARTPNERTQASYLPPNFERVAAANRWHLVDGEADILPGIRVLPTPGHVPFHQSVVIEHGGETACFVGDLIPTVAHLPLAWIMGYDLEPLVTLETKRHFLTRAEVEGWLLILEHEAGPGVGHLVRDGKGVGFRPLDTGPDGS
ncbi:MAG: MBL fold metallo-hydrolase [Gemmatimonadota bacterium]|nr:MBL fold metallo-hydrolase [Gemmatimonadota bacterium]